MSGGLYLPATALDSMNDEQQKHHAEHAAALVDALISTIETSRHQVVEVPNEAVAIIAAQPSITSVRRIATI